MEELSRIRLKIRNKLNNLRNLDYLLTTQSFESLWALSEDDMKKSLRDIVEKEDKNRLLNWVKNHPAIELGEKTIGDLKEIARDLQIPNYSRMTKTQLLIKIRDSKSIPRSELLDSESMIADMMRLIDEMEGMFIEADIPDDYLSVVPNMQYLESVIISDAHDWIHKIYLNQYRKMNKVYNLLTPEMWKRYKMWDDFSDHREVVLLKEAGVELKKAVVSNLRPVLFKKSRIKGLLEKISKAKEELNEGRGDRKSLKQAGKADKHTS